jgi:phage-related tail protein
LTKAERPQKCNQPHGNSLSQRQRWERQQKIYFNFDDHQNGMDKSTSVGNVSEKPRRKFHYTRLDLVSNGKEGMSCGRRTINAIDGLSNEANFFGADFVMEV